MSETSRSAPEALNKYTPEHSEAMGLPTVESLAITKKVATELAGTPFLPKGLSGEKANANILGVILSGREMGLSPMQSLRAFWLSPDGRLGMYADAMMAVMRHAGITFEWHEHSNDKVDFTGTRPESLGGDSFRSVWSTEDSERAGLLSYGDKKMHGKYPADMNRNRAIGRMFRALASDLGGGQMYTREELEDSDLEVPSDVAIEAQKQKEQGAEYFIGVKEAQTPEQPEVIELAKEPNTPVTEPPPIEIEVETVREKIDHAIAAEAPAPTAEPSDFEMRRRMNERVDAMAEVLGSKKAVSEFVAGVQGLKAARRDPQSWDEPMKHLEKIVVSTPIDLLQDLKKRPYANGLFLFRGETPLTEAARSWGWDDAIVMLAKGVLIHQKNFKNYEELVKWMGPDGLALDSKPLPLVKAILGMSRISMRAYILLDLPDPMKAYEKFVSENPNWVQLPQAQLSSKLGEFFDREAVPESQEAPAGGGGLFD